MGICGNGRSSKIISAPMMNLNELCAVRARHNGLSILSDSSHHLSPQFEPL